MPARDDRPAAPTGSPGNPAGEVGRSVLVVRLRAVPPRVLAGVVLAGVVVGLVSGGAVGAILLGVAIALLLTMLAVGWALMALPERLLRIAILVLLIAVSVVRVVPR